MRVRTRASSGFTRTRSRPTEEDQCPDTSSSARSRTDSRSRSPTAAPRSAGPSWSETRELGVTWVHSYVSEDKKTTFCVYDAPTPDAIRATAAANDLPVDRITEVSVLDPYFYS